MKIPIKGKIVKDEKYGNKVVWYKKPKYIGIARCRVSAVQKPLTNLFKRV